MLCKMWGCTPSQLEKEDYDKVLTFGLVYMELIKKNPMMAFG